MTSRVSYAPQDFQKKCKQAERDHESRKLVLLLDRVKKQIAERNDLKLESRKPPFMISRSGPGLPGRAPLFER
jgi:hypothetical protein